MFGGLTGTPKGNRIFGGDPKKTPICKTRAGTLKIANLRSSSLHGWGAGWRVCYEYRRSGLPICFRETERRWVCVCVHLCF